jgi:FtsP/CotA-like multicopper oxidase with cupredoxin domain
VQSFGTEVAVAATKALTWKAPRPGTYLIESGTHPSIQGTMGLYGILVVTSAPTADTTGK